MAQCDVRALPKDEIHKVILLIKKYANWGLADVKYDYGDWFINVAWEWSIINSFVPKISCSVKSNQTKDNADGVVSGGLVLIYPDRSLLRFDGSFEWADEEHLQILHDVIKKYGKAGKNRLSYFGL